MKISYLRWTPNNVQRTTIVVIVSDVGTSREFQTYTLDLFREGKLSSLYFDEVQTLLMKRYFRQKFELFRRLQSIFAKCNTLVPISWLHYESSCMSELVLYNTIRSADSLNFQALPRHSMCNHRLNALMAPKKPDIHTGALEFAQKEAIIKYYNAHPDTNYIDVAEWAQKKFNLEKAPHKSTISCILKNQASFLNLPIQDHMIRRKDVVKNETLEAALLTWVTQKQHQ